MEPTLPQPQIITGPVPTPKRPPKLPLRTRLVIIAVVVAVLVAVGGMAMWFMAQNAANQKDSETPLAEVTISKDGLTPATIKVKKDQDVRWLNQDSQQHKLMSSDKDLASFATDEAIGQGDAYYFSFTKAGTFSYYDPLAPTVIKGTIIVE